VNNERDAPPRLAQRVEGMVALQLDDLLNAKPVLALALNNARPVLSASPDLREELVARDVASYFEVPVTVAHGVKRRRQLRGHFRTLAQAIWPTTK